MYSFISSTIAILNHIFDLQTPNLVIILANLLFSINFWNIKPRWYASYTMSFLLVLMISSNSWIIFAAFLNLSPIFDFSSISILLCFLLLSIDYFGSFFLLLFWYFFLIFLIFILISFLAKYFSKKKQVPL